MSLTVGPDDALIVVDVQRDFLPGGALAVADGERIFVPIDGLAPRFRRVYATRAWHPLDHASYKPFGGPWPVHCVAGTRGAAFDARLDQTNVDCVIDKGVPRATDGYSAFAATSLASDLRMHGVKRVFICGLATDYGVKATAFDAHAAGFATIVIEDASAAVNVQPDDETHALEDLRAAGIDVVRSEDISGNARVRN